MTPRKSPVAGDYYDEISYDGDKPGGICAGGAKIWKFINFYLLNSAPTLKIYEIFL